VRNLGAFLAASVPLRITDLQERGGPGPEEWAWAVDFGEALTYQRDVLLFGDARRASGLANDLSRAVAILAFAPGGVSVFGQHFEAKKEG